jgi:hypothetical protein
MTDECERLREEANRYRIEADCALRDYDALELAHGRLREQLDAARQALQELLDWSDRMPDAGFTSESPRWQWWHERPAAAARAALGVGDE